MAHSDLRMRNWSPCLSIQRRSQPNCREGHTVEKAILLRRPYCREGHTVNINHPEQLNKNIKVCEYQAQLAKQSQKSKFYTCVRLAFLVLLMY